MILFPNSPPLPHSLHYNGYFSLITPCTHHSYLESTLADMEILFEFFMHALCQCLGVGIVVAIDRLVVRRRHAIVRIVHRLQAILSIPACLSLVSETAPGITDESLRRGIELAAYLAFISPFPFIVLAVAGKGKSLWGLVAGIAGPACAIISVWIYFIRARQAFDRGKRDALVKGGGDNPGLRRSIACVMGVPL